MWRQLLLTVGAAPARAVAAIVTPVLLVAPRVITGAEQDATLRERVRSASWTTLPTVRLCVRTLHWRGGDDDVAQSEAPMVRAVERLKLKEGWLVARDCGGLIVRRHIEPDGATAALDRTSTITLN